VTYKATRYVRHGIGPHRCPDAHPTDPHALMRDRAQANTWVCPRAFGQEVSEAYIALREASVAEMRRADADRLAREGMERYEADLRDGKRPSIHETIVAATLAMAELEAVR
jgi:hypothetical protein